MLLVPLLQSNTNLNTPHTNPERCLIVDCAAVCEMCFAAVVCRYTNGESSRSAEVAARLSSVASAGRVFLLSDRHTDCAGVSQSLPKSLHQKELHSVTFTSARLQ